MTLSIRRDPPRPFLCVAGLIYRDDIAGPINAAISRFASLSTALDGLGPQIALYHPQGRDPFGPNGEPFWMGRELHENMDAPAGLQRNWTPGGDAAVAIHHGAYDRMLDTHFALHRAVELAGRKLVGPNWERYGPEQKGQTELQTEVCYLLAD